MRLLTACYNQCNRLKIHHQQEKKRVIVNFHGFSLVILCTEARQEVFGVTSWLLGLWDLFVSFCFILIQRHSEMYLYLHPLNPVVIS